VSVRALDGLPLLVLTPRCAGTALDLLSPIGPQIDAQAPLQMADTGPRVPLPPRWRLVGARRPRAAKRRRSLRRPAAEHLPL